MLDTILNIVGLIGDFVCLGLLIALFIMRKKIK